jgi:hypothetical protein
MYSKYNFEVISSAIFYSYFEKLSTSMFLKINLGRLKWNQDLHLTARNVFIFVSIVQKKLWTNERVNSEADITNIRQFVLWVKHLANFE